MQNTFDYDNLLSYSAIIGQEKILANLRINGHSPMFYLPISSLPVVYSIGAYFDNLVCELSMFNCYNKTW